MSFRPAFKVGTPIFRRDRHHLQIGTSPGHTLRDRPGLLHVLRMIDGLNDRPTLERLVDGVTDFEDELAPVLDDLLRVGIVLDASLWDLAPRRGSEVLALAHRGLAADDISARLSRRRAARLVLVGDEDCRPLASRIAAIAREAQVGADPDGRAPLHVVLTVGEGNRSTFADLDRRGMDHLPIVLGEGQARWGPLVRHRETPCTGCHDLQRIDFDPHWSTLMTQFGRRPPAAGVCQSLGSAGLQMTAATIAAQIIAYADNHQGPADSHVWSTQPGAYPMPDYEVRFHTSCGCRLLSNLC